MMISHKVGGLAAVAGLSLVLVSGGLYASWSDSAQVQGGANVGTFACELSSTTPGAVVSGDTVSYTEPPIQSSVIGDVGTLSVDVKATGSIPVLLHWTWVASDAPGGHWETSMGNPSIADDVTLAAGESKHYDDLGFVVTALDNTDLGTVHSVTYTASCAEVPAAPAISIVPPVRGMAESDAITALLAAGLVAGARSEAHDSAVSAGAVIGTAPPAGAEVPPGTPVDYVVSLGVALVEVPDVVGDPVGDAVAEISGVGLVPGTRTDIHHASIAAGSVISTDPAAGVAVAPGTAVNYVVSLGEEPPPPPPVEFIGTATAASTAAVTYPAGTQPGDIVVAVSTRWAAANSSLIGGPAAGFTKVGSTLSTGGKSCVGGGTTCYQTTAAFYHVVAAGETATASWPNTRIVRIAVYRHASVGAVSGAVGSNYPALTLQVTDGSSWVAGLAAGTGITATTYSTSSGGGVTTWPATPVGFASHAFSIELKRTP
jgi:predicted ribosomally synthesized peptide with SipW-like signal peptide